MLSAGVEMVVGRVASDGGASRDVELPLAILFNAHHGDVEMQSHARNAI